MAELAEERATKLAHDFGEGADPLGRQKAYRLATVVVERTWHDSSILYRHGITRTIADQLYRSAGSIGANFAEGYSRSSGRDRVRLLEYALGSARECRFWYRAGSHVLPAEHVGIQANYLNEICRLLMSTIPRDRDRLIRAEKRV